MTKICSSAYETSSNLGCETNLMMMRLVVHLADFKESGMLQSWGVGKLRAENTHRFSNSFEEQQRVGSKAPKKSDGDGYYYLDDQNIGKDCKWDCQSQTKDKDKKHKTTIRDSEIGIDRVTGFPIVNDGKDTSFKPFRDKEESSPNRDKEEVSICGNRGIIKRDRKEYEEEPAMATTKRKGLKGESASVLNSRWLFIGLPMKVWVWPTAFGDEDESWHSQGTGYHLRMGMMEEAQRLLCSSKGQRKTL
ncbi:hypothetical protein PPACK8108_LOCUS13330 [Phakopsora pachyrhizi]|uniref:Uncharacterized protein n=1 Tax=Phakopsora pachyrhizi TaxID=170000 RepID=A0AAV0B841_PHAPC|nr:hypothetical protein PPACK8108_LOCUS13330 [Phakopsora pachyrhizi]